MIRHSDLALFCEINLPAVDQNSSLSVDLLLQIERRRVSPMNPGDNEDWDDTELQATWDAALAEYKVRRVQQRASFLRHF